MTVKSSDLLARYGNPRDERNMGLWYCPPDLMAANPYLPKRIYSNNDIHHMLTAALYKCHEKGVLGEITSFGGCFNIRNIRGSGQQSLHSFGYAVDFNTKDNPLGKTREQCLAAGLTPFTETFVRCWEATGWEWGGRWNRFDGMHFQPARMPNL